MRRVSSCKYWDVFSSFSPGRKSGVSSSPVCCSPRGPPRPIVGLHRTPCSVSSPLTSCDLTSSVTTTMNLLSGPPASAPPSTDMSIIHNLCTSKPLQFCTACHVNTSEVYSFSPLYPCPHSVRSASSVRCLPAGSLSPRTISYIRTQHRLLIICAECLGHSYTLTRLFH